MRLFPVIIVAMLAYSISSWAEEEKHGHEAVHGGCLNVIGSCENGHAEVKLDGDKVVDKSLQIKAGVVVVAQVGKRKFGRITVQ